MSGYWATAAKAAGSWDFQEQSGDSATDSVAGRDGALLNGLSFDSGRTAGPTSWLPSALDFTASAHMIRVPFASELNTPQYTVHAWAKWGGGGVTAYAALWNCRTANPVLSGHLLYKSNVGRWQHWYGWGGPSWRSYGNEPAGLDWVFLATTYDGSVSRIYVNGVQVAQSVASDYVANTTEPLTIGNIPSLTTPFGGAMAAFAVYDVALTASELTELFSGPEPVAESAPTLLREPAVGESVAFTPATWQDPGNGTMAVQHVVVLSDDGVSAWTPAPEGVSDGVAILDASLVGKFLRVDSMAANAGGAADPATSAIYTVRPPTTPIRAVAHSVLAHRAAAGHVAVTGADAGFVVPVEAA